MKYFTLFCIIVILNQCNAGLLKTFGKGTENLGSAINQGAIKAEDSLHSLFHGKKEEDKQAVKPVVPDNKPPVIEKKDMGLSEIGTEKRPDLAGAPQIEIVYGKSAATTPKTANRNSAVITDDDDDMHANKMDEADCADPKNKERNNCRDIIKGTMRCGAGEISVNGSCRPKDE